ncbi:CDP-diacylglycerol--glycerol-3-phosphate 3-phosphatidyltransferase [Trichostrongylus colubriformis]|uniref:CDP-diacylglycerol--glycerol-3-phosphate 3-phosphatidyltransferase n=1 Tax=Trichostrongylus colubriformis TaxID=6319 RepID=A0AAN8F435_TRICO
MEFELPKSRAISISAENVQILDTPTEFYQFLLKRSQSAQKRITLSTLYLGDGSLEHALVDAISSNLKENEELKVAVLLDCLRGTRGERKDQSSTTLLKAIADRASVYLFHTPKLAGVMKRILPERTNEIVGLQHMKLYIFDDTVLISGANLSDSYFVNRQDRYVVFENNKELADFFHNVVSAVGECSFLLSSDGSMKLHPSCTVHPYEGSFSDFHTMLKSRVDKVVATLKDKESVTSSWGGDTVLYPLLQMGLFGYHDEYELLKRLFSSKDADMCITMASGYFNCIEEYERLIFAQGEYSMDIITAAPKANGFFGAAGLSGYVPSMYSWVSAGVLQLKEKYKRNTVNMYEYYRDGWTFHAKGLWIETPGHTATLIGSSNFGYRSVHRDLEAQILLVTSNERLRNQLKDLIVFTVGSMALRPIGILIGKVLLDNSARKAGPAQIVRTSATLATYHNFRHRKRNLRESGTNPFQREEILNRIGGNCIRRTHTHVEREAKLLKESLDKENWMAVYRYPRIRFAVLLARAKLIQTVVTVLYLPYSSYQYLLGHVDVTWFYSTAMLAVLAPLTLAVFSRYLNRLIGVIAMNESNDYVRIGYLSFWGSRRNKYVEVADVLPLTEVGGNKNDALVKFSWFGASSFLYLPTKGAEIVDEHRAKVLFGDLSLFN